MNQSLLETKLFSGSFFPRKVFKVSLDWELFWKENQPYFTERNIFWIQKSWQFSMSIPSCRPHPTCLMLIPLPPLGLTSFASWCVVSMSWLLILQDSGNFLSFICPRLVFLAGSPHLWDSPTFPMSIQLSILPFSSGTDLVFGSHIQTHPPTPQMPGDTYRIKGWWETSTSLRQFDNNVHVPP